MAAQGWTISRPASQKAVFKEEFICLVIGLFRLNRQVGFSVFRRSNQAARQEIDLQGNGFAEAEKEWAWFKPGFSLDVPSPNDHTITGSLWQHEFEFERSGRKVASVRKDNRGWSDSYEVKIVDGEDAVPILCTWFGTSLVLHDDRKE